MKPRFTLGAIFVAAALAGCSTTSENDYEVVKTALEGSPKFRADIAGKCAAKIAKQPKSERKALALVVNTSEAKAPRIVCSRAVRAYASGRLTYEDVRMVERGEVTPNIVKILQGR